VMAVSDAVTRAAVSCAGAAICADSQNTRHARLMRVSFTPA